MSDAIKQDSVSQRLQENATGIVSTIVTGVWMGAMFTGQDWWLAALLVGYVAVVPITAMLFGDEEEAESIASDWIGNDSSHSSSAETGANEETPLETVRRRYAEGELTEAQFEQKLEQLLSTESIEDVDERGRDRAVERER